WATITCAVAARLERIKLLSRTEPDRNALDEFSRDEIDAAIALRKPKGVAPGATPTLGEVTRWIADIGGYTGKSSGGPPGIRVLSRGFDRVEAAASALTNLRELSQNRG
ncbi:MAG TPA: IS4 family transposase, partial [Kofleriaceae bacterium]|nr:IS4 family transposase [Kofleriaceae bacterium]